MNKFKTYDEYVNETLNSLNEEKEKFKIREAKPSHQNGEAAFVIKFVGMNFDDQQLRSFMSSSPTSSPAFQKVTQNPQQYFFIYKTLKNGDSRFLDANNHVWATYLELINAIGQDGKPLYIGFDKPPYNNFVKWTDAERLINQQDPAMIQTSKAIVASVANAGTVQAQQDLASSTPTPQVAPVQNTAPQSQVQAPVPNAAPGLVDTNLQGLKGIGINSSGPQVLALQQVIANLAAATKNTAAAQTNHKNLRVDGHFDQRYGPNTAMALGQVLGTNTPINTIDDATIAKISQTAQSMGVSGILTGKPQPETAAPAKAHTPAVTAPATHSVAANTGTHVPANHGTGAQSSPSVATRSIETNLGKIYF